MIKLAITPYHSENEKLKFRMWFKYGLKAQKLLAQGIALGIMAISKAPCKVGCSKSESKSGIKNGVISVQLSY